MNWRLWFIPLFLPILAADGIASFLNYFLAVMSHDSDGATGSFHFTLIDGCLLAQFFAWGAVLVAPFLTKLHAAVRLVMVTAPMLITAALWVTIDVGTRMQRGG